MFIGFIFFAKLLGKKIVWVLHNIYSHEKTDQQWAKFLFRLMIKKSDLILTHSSGGVTFVQNEFPRHALKVKYIIHPVEELFPLKSEVEKKYDFLIWGTIHPYKGVIEFLEFVKQSPELKNSKILISGICPDSKLKEQLLGHISENIKHIDKFSDINEIAELANQSHFILFTYNSESVLSSGSLMDSIRMGASIIGPNKGAFNDLSNFSFINTYKTYKDIVDMLSDKNLRNSQNQKEIEMFCYENSWAKFEDKLFKAGETIF
jgi:glycosyltransferase involved in cell wall biosynthesis